MGLLQMFWRAFLAWLIQKLSMWAKIEPPTKPAASTQKYSVQSPESYVREHFPDTLDNEYRWRLYNTPLDQLYDSDRAAYEKHRFKYKRPKDTYAP